MQIKYSIHNPTRCCREIVLSNVPDRPYCMESIPSSQPAGSPIEAQAEVFKTNTMNMV